MNECHEKLRDMKQSIRHVLVRCRSNDRPISELDRFLIRAAADALAVVLMLDARMRIAGALLPEQNEIYVEACRHRDAYLKGLGVSNPYAAAVQ